MLKFEDKFTEGQKIRAYDFEPSSDRPDMYIEGIIINAGTIPGEGGLKAYEIEVTFDSSSHVESFSNRVGDRMYIPFEVSLFEYDERIQIVVA